MYPNQQKEQYVYDESSNLVSLESQSKLAYSYDATGKVVEKTKRTDKEVQTTAYTYTPSGALIQATSTPSTSSGTDLAGSGSGSLHFAYNKAGNRIEHLQRYNSLNQLIEDDDHLYAYDKRGNLIEKLHKVHKTRTLYTFNLFDQLTKVKRTDKQNRLIEGFTYSYDALNRRVSKTTYTQETFPNGTTHHYLYDDENIVAILDHNKTLLATIVHDTQTDTPLSITTYNNEAKPLDDYEKHKLYTKLTDQEKLHIYQSRQQRTYYYHRDHQGSITALTDSEGNIVESFLYDDAYGTIVDHHIVVNTYNPYCYTGREFDAQDLYYYRARYYDPTVGRFISKDPIEFLAGDTNFYRYVGGDPVNFVDPSGLRCVRPPSRIPGRRGKYRVLGTRPIEESLPPAEYIPRPPNPTGEARISAPRPYRNRPYNPVLDPDPNPIIYPKSEARVEPCKVAVENKVAVDPGEKIKGKKPKCKKICFSLNTADYPKVKDINGKVAPKPPTGEYKLPVPYIRTKADYRKVYEKAKGTIPEGIGAQVHHILPGWAGGSDDATNLVALTKGHTGEGSLHRWWGDKLKENKENLNNKMVQCAKQNGEKGAAITQCQMGKGNMYPPVIGQILKTGESGIPNVAQCLGDKGVALTMAVDKPCTK